MVDLTSYNVDVKKPLTQEEFRERIKKGLIKSGDIVDVYDEWGNVRETHYVEIFTPMPNSIKYYELTK